MKHFQSLVEGFWVEIHNVEISDEQKALLMSSDLKDKKAKQQLVSKIKSEREVAIPKKKENELKSLYDSLKPSLKDGDVYTFICADVHETEGGYTGIINCRINKEHKQVRF